MKKLTRNILLIAFFLLTCSPLSAEEPDFNSLETVLDTFADSRKTRELKKHSSAETRDAFTKTLETEVYKPVDSAVIKHLEQMPEFEGKRILTHDFRTPGKDGASVNTDRDVRVLVEVEMDRWIEVPVDKWEDVYYREFAKRTGMKVDNTTSDDLLKEQAAKYRQLPTDRFHMEAGADYSDAGDIRAFEVNGRTKVLSTPNVVRAKKGLARLKDPEGLARMYLEKADEQYRRAKELELKVKDGGLSNEEVRTVMDKLEMHEIEGTVQLKKGIESLEALRSGYEKQGYDVGRLPDAVQKVVTEIKKVDGTRNTDIKKIKADLSALGPESIKNLGDVNQKISGQIESLKMVRKKPASTKSPNVSLARTGQAAGIAGDILSIKDALKKAEQGNHLFINFDTEDTKGEKALKAMALAAVELSPIPVIEAMERGWQVDEEEKNYIRNMMERGEYGDWKIHPVTSMARVSTKVICKTVSSMTLDPLIAGKTAVEDGYEAMGDMGTNFIAEFSRQESGRLQSRKLDEFIKRSEAFDLGVIEIFDYHRSHPPDIAVPGNQMRFSLKKNETWTNEYLIRWEIITPERKTIPLKESIASDDGANSVMFDVPALALGEYQVYARAFEKENGLQVDFTHTSFTMTEKTDLGRIIAAHDTPKGKPVAGKVIKGDVIAFYVDKIGRWNNSHKVEWLVNGERYRKESADKEKSNELILNTEDLAPGNHTVAVRIFESTIFDTLMIAHQAYDLKIKEEEIILPTFEVRGFVEGETKNMPLAGPVQNGETLRFTAVVKPVESRKPVKTRLLWQVYDQEGNPVEGMHKEETVPDSDSEKEYRFRFKPVSFSDGSYTVNLTRSLVSDPDNRFQSRASFELQDIIRIEKALITDNKETMEPKDVFYPEQRPLFYVYYKPKPGLEKVSVSFSAKKNGKQIESTSIERILEKEKSPPYRVGYTVTDAAFKAGDTGEFSAKIKASDSSGKIISKTFKVVDYRASLSLPEFLVGGISDRFYIKVPEVFEPPYRVELSPGSGLSLLHKPGELTGMVSGVHEKRDKTVNLGVQVTDTQGRVAKGENSLTIKKQKVAAKPKRIYVPPQPVDISGESTPQRSSSVARSSTSYNKSVPSVSRNQRSVKPSGPSRSEIIETGRKMMRSNVKQVVENLKQGAFNYENIKSPFFANLTNKIMANASQDLLYKFGSFCINNNYNEVENFRKKLEEQLIERALNYSFSPPYSLEKARIVGHLGSYEQYQRFRRKFKSQIDE